RRIKLQADVEGGTTLRGDRAQLGLLVSNLVDNAMRYTKTRGRVTVSLGSIDNTIVIRVEDTGEGIPAGELSRVFERFYRVDKARTRQTGGTGLGLAIVRHVAESHGGTVGVESVANKGSTFTVRLPASGPPTPSSKLPD